MRQQKPFRAPKAPQGRSVRAGYGIGDNLYLYPIAKHLRDHGPLTVLTDYPQIFDTLDVQTAPFSRAAQIHAVYTMRKNSPHSQYVDMCQHARLTLVPALSMDRPIKNLELEDRILSAAGDRKVCILQAPRGAFGRADGFGRELLPNFLILAKVVQWLRERFFVVQIGKGQSIYKLPCDLDLQDRTSISDFLDLGQIGSLFVGQCSNIIPLAEACDDGMKKVWILFSQSGLNSKNPFVSRVTPQKVFHKRQMCYHSVDSEKMDAIKETICKL